jgi:hypothetical protein
MSQPFPFQAVASDASWLAGFQRLLTRCPTASQRKELILSARLCGALEVEQTELLIQAHQLETA